METPEPPRLVKLLLSADLVRQMDRAIVAGAGAYQDRNEFVSEAIRDRLAEEQAALATSRPSAEEQSPAEPLPTADDAPTTDRDADLQLGEWQTFGRAPVTVAADPTSAVSFGLHNRDLPTLWALDWLAMMSSSQGGPVHFGQFVDVIRERSVGVGDHLRLRDLEQATAVNAATGFPKPGPKVYASLDRFIASSVGSSKRADGPLFDLGLASFVDGERQQIAPTHWGLQVLSALLAAGLGPRLPQPASATQEWLRFLSHAAPAEHAAWRKVLRVIAEQPDRDQLVARFPEWPGQIASTNTIGFVSRSREWGLVEPKLIDGRYRLTELGVAFAGEG